MPRAPRIDSAFFGSFIIEGRKYDHDVVLSWRENVQKRKRTHEFTRDELAQALVCEPEIIIVGKGYSNLVKVDHSVEVAARIVGVPLIIESTPKAVEEYNKLARAGKKVIAVLHATC